VWSVKELIRWIEVKLQFSAMWKKLERMKRQAIL
jgi:hypothetical protein